MKTTRSCTTTTSTGGTTPGRSAGGVNGGGGGGSGSARSLTTAQQQLESAQAALAATRIVAPQDGVVAAVNLTVGTLPAAPAIELRTTTFSVQVPVAEQDAPYVEAGQQVQLSFSALGVTGAGTVAAAPLMPSSSGGGATSAGRAGGGTGSAGVVTYPVTVAISDPPPGALVGMSVQAAWTAQTRTDVLAVPTAALQGTDAGYVVRVLIDGRPQLRTVTLGLSTTSLTEITDGLRPGEPVVTGVR